jgi:ubiquinone/menaquinone biosynthesis C-methylase UbiE
MPHQHDRRFDPSKLARLDSEQRRLRTPPEAIRAAAEPFAGKRVADVGAGAGFFSVALLDAAEPPAHIDAIDVSTELLSVLADRLRTHRHGERGRTHCAPAEALPLENGAVDLVMLGMVLHELDDAAAGLREAHRILAEDGRILLVDWDRPEDATGEPEAGPPYAQRTPKAAARIMLEQAGFHDVRSHGGFELVYTLTARRGR